MRLRGCNDSARGETWQKKKVRFSGATFSSKQEGSPTEGLALVGAGQFSPEMGQKVEEMSTDVGRSIDGAVGACLLSMIVSIFHFNRK